MYNLKRKSLPGSGMELNPEFKEINRLKKSSIKKEIKGIVIPGQDPTRLIFHLVKRNYRISWSYTLLIPALQCQMYADL